MYVLIADKPDSENILSGEEGMKRKICRITLFAGIVGLLGCCKIGITSLVKAAEKTITINTANYDGGKAIQEAFDQQAANASGDTLVVKLEPGTYNITESLIVYSNTTVDATGATLKYVRTAKVEGSDGRAPMIANECAGKGGYTGASNIAINGGTWDFQGSKGQVNAGMTLEAFRFMHGKNISFTNLTMQNLKKSHYLTIEGVDNVTIKDCTFKDFRSPSAKKEAIHIDCMHNDAMAPSNQDNTIYDDTICNNVTVDGCTFTDVPRGIGTHIAVAGLYPSNMKFTNNTFKNITYEAIKAYHYKNVTITGNTISGAGCGIKSYLYAEPSDNDNDEEGNSNYLPALKKTVTEGVPADINVLISQNTIQNIRDSKVGFGIHIAGNTSRPMQGVTVTNNTVASTKLAGIYAKYANQITMADNKVSNAGGPAILVTAARQSVLERNQLAVTEGDALLVQDSQTSRVTNNTISYAKKHGIYMNSVSGAMIQGNVLEKDKNGGIGSMKCKKIQILDNVFRSSGKNAIVVQNSASANVCNNQVEGAKKFGVYVFSSNQALVQKNTIQNTKSSGIVIQKGTGIKVKGNTVKKAGKYGILFTKTKKSSAFSNSITSAKNISLCYSKDSKNRKQNLYFLKLDLKKGAKAISGRVIAGVKVAATMDEKTKTKKSSKKGDFKIGVKKLKKGTLVKFTLKDSRKNEAVIYRRVK